MRPSSSPSDLTGGGLFDGVLSRGPVRALVGDGAWLQAMLDFEAALAAAQALVGLVPEEIARTIGEACRADAFDVGELGRAAADTGNPVVPMLQALRGSLVPEAAGHLHRGATSQDVIDTAAMLVAAAALDALLEDLDGCAEAAAGLAGRYRDVPMAGRTLLQQATPTTFGLKAAGWMSGLDRASEVLAGVRRTRLAVQFGGATGTLADLGQDGPAVLRKLAGELGLAEPVLPWHTERTRMAELAAGLAEAAGATAKPAMDVVLMAQTEVGEVREGVARRGGSSAMAHKQNPVAAVSTLACARRAPGLAAELLSAMPQEHERAAGAWHAEWRPLSELLATVGSAAAWLRDCLEHLSVDEGRMRDNLDLTEGMAEAAGHPGSAVAFVDRALEAHAARGAGRLR